MERKTPYNVREMYADIFALTPAELADLLSLASWMIEYPEKSTRADRFTIAQQLRRTMKQVNPTNYTSMAGAAEYYRPGVYNGD